MSLKPLQIVALFVACHGSIFVASIFGYPRLVDNGFIIFCPYLACNGCLLHNFAIQDHSTVDTFYHANWKERNVFDNVMDSREVKYSKIRHLL